MVELDNFLKRLLVIQLISLHWELYYFSAFINTIQQFFVFLICFSRTLQNGIYDHSFALFWIPFALDKSIQKEFVSYLRWYPKYINILKFCALPSPSSTSSFPRSLLSSSLFFPLHCIFSASTWKFFSLDKYKCVLRSNVGQYRQSGNHCRSA